MTTHDDVGLFLQKQFFHLRNISKNNTDTKHVMVLARALTVGTEAQ